MLNYTLIFSLSWLAWFSLIISSKRNVSHNSRRLHCFQNRWNNVMYFLFCFEKNWKETVQCLTFFGLALDQLIKKSLSSKILYRNKKYLNYIYHISYKFVDQMYYLKINWSEFWTIEVLEWPFSIRSSPQ